MHRRVVMVPKLPKVPGIRHGVRRRAPNTLAPVIVKPMPAAPEEDERPVVETILSVAATQGSNIAKTRPPKVAKQPTTTAPAVTKKTKPAPKPRPHRFKPKRPTLRGHHFIRRAMHHLRTIPARSLIYGASAAATTAIWALVTPLLPLGLLREVLAIAFVAIVPGYYLFRVIAGYDHDESKAKLIGYSLGLSLLIMMLAGLGLNQLSIVLGRDHVFAPTTLARLLGAITICNIALATIIHRPVREGFHAEPAKVRLKTIVKHAAYGLASLVLPILAVGGANMLNNNGPSYLAFAVLVVVALIPIVALWRKNTSGVVYPYALYSICLTMLLGTSMRGWNITGHDVMQEFQVFELTLRHDIWRMQFYQDAYTACLSITILPTIIQRLSGITDQYVFKMVFQVFFAMIAPILYSTLRPYVTKKLAFIAVFIFMTFPTFITDVPMLNRQEIALLFLALSLQVSLNASLPKLRRNIIGALFLVGMVLSHYSTSYVAVGAFVVMVVMEYIVYRFQVWRVSRRIAKARKMRPLRIGHAMYHPGAVLIAVIALALWGGPATHTAGNIMATVKGLYRHATAAIEHTPPATPINPATAYDANLAGYSDYTLANRSLPAADYYSGANKIQVTESKPYEAAETAALKAAGVPESALNLGYGLLRQAYVAAIGGLVIVGLALLAFSKWKNRLPRQYLYFGAGCLVVALAQAVAPADSVNYGFARMIQQALLVLSLPAALAAVWLLKLLRIKGVWGVRVVAVGLVMFFAIFSGILPAVTGGYKPSLALSNNGFYYEAYYTHQQEVAADAWLATNSPLGSRVYSDEFTRRKMITYAGIFPQPTLIPGAIPVDSYVVLSNGNTVSGQVPAYFRGALLYYNAPTPFLDANKGLLYDSGYVVIYK